MTKEREIINEKLNTIDYGLNVDAMWGELEHKLPPEKRKRKFAFLWMWTGLALLLLVAGFFYIQKPVTHEGNLTATDSTKTAEQSANNLVASSNSSNNTVNDAVSSSTEKYIVNTEKIGNRPSPNTTKMPAIKESQRTNEARSQVNNISEINDEVVVTKKISRNQTSSVALEGKTAYYNTKERFEVKNDDAQVAFEILNSASSSKSVDPLKSNAQSTISKSSLSVSNREEIYFPFLSTPLNQELKSKTRILQPTIASLVKPVRNPLGIELSLTGNYGYRLGTASLVNSRGFGKIENATTSFVDVSGVELGIAVPVYKRFLLGVGVNYNRFTDKSVSVSETKTSVESLANNGFNFKTETYEFNAFHHTDIVDLHVGFGYAASHGKWSLRPSLGVNYNVYNNIITKSLDENVSTFESQDIGTYAIQKSNTSESLNLGYFGSVTAGYSFTPRLETFAGLKYQSSRNIGEITDSEISSQLTGSIQGTAGIRFRF